MIFNKKKKIEFNSKALLTLELILNELYQATYLENKNTFKNTSGTLNETILDYKKYKNEKLGLYTVESIKAILSDCNNIIKDLDKKRYIGHIRNNIPLLSKNSYLLLKNIKNWLKQLF
jgi:hypothetical protein